MPICGGDGRGVCCACTSLLQLIRLGPVGPGTAPSKEGVVLDTVLTLEGT